MGELDLQVFVSTTKYHHSRRCFSHPVRGEYLDKWTNRGVSLYSLFCFGGMTQECHGSSPSIWYHIWSDRDTQLPLIAPGIQSWMTSVVNTPRTAHYALCPTSCWFCKIHAIHATGVGRYTSPRDPNRKRYDLILIDFLQYLTRPWVVSSWDSDKIVGLPHMRNWKTSCKNRYATFVPGSRRTSKNPWKKMVLTKSTIVFCSRYCLTIYYI